MRFSLIAIAYFTLSAGLLNAESKPSEDKTQFTKAEIGKLTREAHTVDQYTELTQYYAVQQRMFQRKAAEEMHLWALRAEVITPLSEKWPRPVDSARNLHDYYEYKASEAAKMCAKYDRLADEAGTK